MCGLAHLLERRGIATVLIGLVPQHVDAMRPPRALLVPFELGRPLGVPGDRVGQLAVLAAAMDLCDQGATPPAVAWFDAPEAQHSGDETGGSQWVCPVSFPTGSDAGEAVDRVTTEISLLQPWFDRAVARRGHTATGLSGMAPEDAAVWLQQLLDNPTGVLGRGAGDMFSAERFKLAIEDLKAFYLEAATAQPGAPASAAALTEWFWQETAAGALLWSLRERFKDFEGDQALRLHAAFTTVPEVEVRRRTSTTPHAE